MEKYQPQLRLLPNYFKKIGLGIILLVILCALYCIKYREQVSEQYTNILATVFIDFIIIGLLLFALARERIDDELLMLIRLQSMAYAFIFSVLYVVIPPLLGYIISNHIVDMKGLHLILMTLVVYNSIFTFKRIRM